MDNKKKKLLNIFLALPFGIAVITCFIVNFAVDQRFTWSVLVAGSCFWAYLVLFMAVFGGKHRIILALAVLCIFVIPFLYLTEWTANLYVPNPVYWATSFGLPVSICWIAAVIIIVLIQRITHANGWIIAGISVAVFYFAERFTNDMVDKLAGNSDSWRLSDHYPILYFGAAAVLLFIGAVSAIGRYRNKTSEKMEG